ncbi:TPA: IgG-binding virulence factor TspB family protein [Neisseria meningitidis]|nr:IgG-binding virulence factor TspB family protein [Neisseria meningitidis]CWO58044.1 TspB protein [Neisseria meningitidis]CWQ25930.1 TspB protein [Neisseria meningitidis]CWQ42686.1 TspB protein [Neisseria meningitidis]CWR84760.1 TspB protein [Neisseria meningitidis]CWS90605.1 TspB protein [Neisseria meningitidis]
MFLILGRNFLKIILCFSFFVPKFALASVNVPGKFDRVEVYDDGRYLGIRGSDDKRRRIWKGVFDRESGRYLTSEAQDLKVRHVSTGASSTGKVSSVVSSSVSRAAVLSGVGKLARLGAKLSTRAVPYVGTALLAHDVYETFKEDIQAQGYQYDPETDKFVKGYEYSNCLWYEDKRRINRTYGCYGVDSSIMRLMSDDSRFPEVKELMESQMYRLARPFWNWHKEELNKLSSLDWNNFVLNRCTFNWNGGDCLVNKGDDFRNGADFSLIRNSKYKEEMDAKKLEEILSLKVDANPDKYIKATGYPGYSEKVEVAPGTKVNMGPVTDRNGNPVQVVATFGRDSQGNTTVDVQVIPRPDLTPGSAEAPNAQPLPEVSPAENPANNPNPNENPGTSPNPEPDPDLNPDANPDTDGQPGTRPDSPAVPDRPNGRHRKERKEGEDGGLLCDYFPEILACQEMGKPSDGMFHDISIPQVIDDKTWSSHNFLPSNGVCPQPKTFHVFGRQYQASYEPLCVFAEKIRFAVLLAFIIMSAFVVFGSLKGK